MNWDHKRTCIAIAGTSGSGKTTLYLKLWSKWRAKYKFAFDPDRELSRKLGLPACESVEAMLLCVKAQKPVVFDPAKLFPGDYTSGLAFFCRWTYEVCRVLNGRKVLGLDEVQKWVKVGPSGTPQSLIEILDAGRREELDCVFVCNKGMNKLSDEVRGQLTEIYLLRLADRLPLRWAEEEGFNPEEVKILPVGRYVHKII